MHYRVRLRALNWATGLLRDLSHSPDHEAVAVSLHWALDALYDRSEAYQIMTGGRRPVRDLDPELLELSTKKFESPRWQVVGALLVARGKKTHQLAALIVDNPRRELPYDFASLTDWAWAQASWDANDGLAERSSWYNSQVAGRPLWVPLDQAWLWFLINSPSPVPQMNLSPVTSWVSHLRPEFYGADD